jgi:hypothetical protein
MGSSSGLAKEQDRALGRLKDLPGIDRFYLAGGSAIAYHLHHRRSLDLDLFSLEHDADLDALLAAASTDIGDLKVMARSDVTLRLRITETVVEFVRYPYPLLEPTVAGPQGFAVAGLRDLAAMKLATVAGRGLRRDFWDLFVIVRSGLTLVESARCYLARFGLKQPDLYHLARALTWFGEAETEKTYPRGLDEQKWQEIKVFFRSEAPGLLRDP